MQIQRFAQPAGAFAFALVLGSLALTTPQEGRRAVAVPEAGLEEAQVQSIELPGSVPVGTVVAHVLDMPGADGLAALRERGFAVCNGTTPAFQGIPDAVMAGPTPDLNDSGRFLRGADPGNTGLMQDDATDTNGLAVGINDPGHDHGTLISDFANQYNGHLVGFRNINWAGTFRRTFWDSGTFSSGGLYNTRFSGTGISAVPSSTDTETRPLNMGVLWIMRVK